MNKTKQPESWFDHYFDTDRDLYFKIKDLIEKVRQEERNDLKKGLLNLLEIIEIEVYDVEAYGVVERVQDYLKEYGKD